MEGGGRGQNPELISVSQTILLVSFTNVNYMRMTKTKCRTKAYKGSHAMGRMAGEKLDKTLSFLRVYLLAIK